MNLGQKSDRKNFERIGEQKQCSFLLKALGSDESTVTLQMKGTGERSEVTVTVLRRGS